MIVLFDFISTGVNDFDRLFGGIPVGGLVVFVVDKPVTSIGINAVLLPKLKNYFLIDTRGDVLCTFQRSIRKKLILPKDMLDVNSFDNGGYEEGLNGYLKKVPDIYERLVYINGLHEFFVRRLEKDHKESIVDYSKLGNTTVGILHFLPSGDFPERFRKDLVASASLVMGVLNFPDKQNIITLDVWSNKINDILGEQQIFF